MTTPRERAHELLIDRATEGLEPHLARELEGLLAQFPDLDPDSFDLAAAEIELALTSLAMAEAEEPLPAALRDRLTVAARGFAAETPADASAAPRSGRNVVDLASRTERRSSPPSTWLGWLAAAASLILAVVGWWPRVETEPSPSQARQELVAEATDLVELEWTATEDPAAASASGDVVWSTALQKGYMRFEGLPVNDPGVEQYQLWIFDPTQDERYPVDGGVFDISSTGEVVVEITAKLPITDPSLFAITVEKPGGVVVSSRERLPLLAQVG